MALLVGAALIMGLAGLWAKARYDDAKHGTEGDLIKEGSKRQKEAEDAAVEERKRLDRDLG